MAAYYRAINKNPYDALPLTFHVSQGINDVEYGRFLEAYNLIAQDIRAREIEKEQILMKRREEQKKAKKDEGGASESEYEDEEDEESDEEDEEDPYDDEFKIPKNIWIVKPGENTNRGNGIQVCKTLADIRNIVTKASEEEGRHTFIVQRYIE